MSFSNKFLLALCVTVALMGCDDRRVDVYIHEDTGCMSDADCSEAYSDDTFAWCDVEAGNGTCHYQTYIEQPSCYGDWDCDDGDPSSVDTCSAEGCTHVIREVVTIEVPVSSEETSIVVTFDTEGRLLIADPNTWQKIGDLTIEINDVPGRRQIFGAVFSGINAGAWSGIALAQNGLIVNHVIPSAPPAGSNTSSIDFSFNDLIVVSGDTLTYEVWGKIDPDYFVSTASSDPSVSIALTGLRMNGIGEDVIVSSDSNIFHGWLRHSKPTVTRQALSTTTLANTTLDLYKLQISADANGPVEVFSIAFKIEGNAPDGQIANFRVRMGGIQLPLDSYEIYRADGVGDFKYGTIHAGSSNVMIVRFIEPLVIVGSGVLITLSATISGTQAGEAVSTSLTSHPTSVIAADVDNVGRLAFSNGMNYVSAIVWRDTYHQYGNRANGAYDISDLTQVQMLTR